MYRLFFWVAPFIGIHVTQLSATPVPWIRIATSHFEMYTTNNKSATLRELEWLERARSFFIEHGSIGNVPSGCLRIIAFRSQQEYGSYQVGSANAFAYYEQAWGCEYIVLSDISPEHYSAAVHEYAHYIIHHTGLTLPLWLNEGLADFYSSLELHDGRAVLGAPLSDRLYVLATKKWLPLDELFSIDRDSPDYNQSDRAQIFYAESWALVHMLESDGRYSEHFTRFLEDIENGHSAAEALGVAFGKTMQQVYSDLRAYSGQIPNHKVAIDLLASAPDLSARISEPSDMEVHMVMAHVLASNPSKTEEAQQLLEAISAAYPKNAEPEVLLGYLAWQRHDPMKARFHFAAAVERGSTDAKMMADYAAIELASGGTKAEALALLERALAVDPDNYDVRLHLGLLAASQKQPELGISALTGLKRLKPDDTFSVLITLAYLQIQCHDLTCAKRYAERAIEYARRPEERAAAQRILVYAGSRD
jgi:tetratricopeptide (TPR) repeat protein